MLGNKKLKTPSGVITKGTKALPKKKKITRRKAGAPSKKYFDEQAQQAIVDYQNSKSRQEKEIIYISVILPAFDALVENLINVYGFKVLHDSKKDLKAECLEFLYTTVNKFDTTRGSKAFSYFNVVAKNWLTIKSKQSDKKFKQHISLDNKEHLSQSDLELIEQYNIIPSYDEIVTTVDMQNMINKILEELEKRVKTENEIQTVKAIQLISSRLEDIDFLNKRALLIYIREITNLSSKQLSIVLSSLKKHYRDIKKQDEFEI